MPALENAQTAARVAPKAINTAARKIQDQIVDEAMDALERGEDVLIIAPTGAGKTYMGNAIARKLIERGDDGVTLQMRKRIALQNIAKAPDSGIDPKKTAIVYDGDLGDAAQKAMVYALPQTLAERPGAIGRRDFVMIDEVHRAVQSGDKVKDDSKELSRVLADLTDANPGLSLVGMTASPYPSEGNRLHPRMERATRIALTYEDAISAGMITGIKTVIPDYKLTENRWIHSEIENKLEDRDIERSKAGLQTLIRSSRRDDFMDMVVDVVVKNGLQDKPALGFADRIEEAERLTEAMNRRGIPAAVIHSKMSDRDIDRAVKAYEAGTITKLNSVDMIGEGFDAPNTVGVVNLKALMTRVEYIQVNGRAQRLLAGKSDGVMIDFGASSALYGTMNDFRKVQQFTTNPDRSNFNPWITLEKEPAYIRALVTGKDVYFALAVERPGTKPGSAYHVLHSTVDRVTQTRRLIHVRPTLMSAADLKAFAVERVSANETDFMSLRTRRVMYPVNKEAQEISRAAALAIGLIRGQRENFIRMAPSDTIGLKQTQANEAPKTNQPVRRKTHHSSESIGI